MKTILISLTMPLFFISCGTLKPVKDTSVHHLLDAGVSERMITGASPSIAISRPSLPGYLDRQQLVSRSGDGQLQMNSHHLWAEPLDAAISRVTATNLGRLTNSLNIQPVENFVTIDYQTLLEIRVSRFEPGPSNDLVLECTWKLQPVVGGVANARPFRTTVAVTPADSPKDMSGRIAAMNEALVRLAKEISRAL